MTSDMDTQASAQGMPPHVGAFTERGIFLQILFALAFLSLAGCDVSPGCGPVSPGTGGWQVQCSGIASVYQQGG